jgi:hypothetical protein
VNQNLVHFLQQRSDVFPLRTPIDVERLLGEALPDAVALPVPAKIFLLDEQQLHGYGFPVTRSAALDDATKALERWIREEIAVRITDDGSWTMADEARASYLESVIQLAQNALHSSILADYHAVFWLVHSQQVSRIFTGFPRRALGTGTVDRQQADELKYLVFARWTQAIREIIPTILGHGTTAAGADERASRFLRFLLDNPLLASEDYVSNDLGELRTYFAGYLRKDFAQCRRWIDELRMTATDLMQRDRLFRRAVTQLGYPDGPPGIITLLDRRVQELIAEHPAYPGSAADPTTFEPLAQRLLELFVVQSLRRGILWMKTTADGDNVADETLNRDVIYSRAIRPMNFGRRGIVEPIVYRYGLVYDITSFTQTLGEIARGGKDEEQSSYRQMLEFQRDLAEISRRHGLQFEKFLGDGAFYTSRRATRTIQAAVDIQSFYFSAKKKGFAFNKGMRVAVNYGYYRLLPMQVSTDGTEIMEFYGPGIVELSRLTSGKATKEIEEIQHLLLSHGYDQLDVYRFFAPLSRTVEGDADSLQGREYYAYIDENGHLVNEGIVISIPFIRQLSAEVEEEQQKIYRLRSTWGNYIGFPASDGDGYVAMRLLGAVSLKGIGSMDVAEVVRLRQEQAEVSVIDEVQPLLRLLQRERYRSTARHANRAAEGAQIGMADLVVCESTVRSGGTPVILVGEWDPVSEEVRRPIQLDGSAVERYGLAMPLSVHAIESQSLAYQKLYQNLSRIETLPTFSVQAIRDNTNFSGFIIGATVEPL